MSGASWEPDPKLTRDKHNWVFHSACPQEWGCTINIRCMNSGCSASISFGLTKEKWPKDFGSICFDRHRAVQLTDRDGRPISQDDKGEG